MRSCVPAVVEKILGQPDERFPVFPIIRGDQGAKLDQAGFVAAGNKLVDDEALK